MPSDLPVEGHSPDDLYILVVSDENRRMDPAGVLRTILTPEIKERLPEVLPHAIINDTVGASETGAQGTHLSVKGAVSTGTFGAGPGAVVVNEDMTALHEPGHEGPGWLGQSGYGGHPRGACRGADRPLQAAQGLDLRRTDPAVT